MEPLRTTPLIPDSPEERSEGLQPGPLAAWMRQIWADRCQNGPPEPESARTAGELRRGVTREEPHAACGE